MPTDFERLLKLAAPFVKGHSEPGWDFNRSAIRRSLVEELKLPGAEPSWEEATLNLVQLPAHPNYSISISHTAGEGAWVSAKDFYAGLDIEQSARLNPHLLARIATEPERARAPDARYLWCAKEAAFKALSSRARGTRATGETVPQTLSEVEILRWVLLEKAYVFYAFLGQGWLIDGGDRIYALYLVPK